MGWERVGRSENSDHYDFNARELRYLEHSHKLPQLALSQANISRAITSVLTHCYACKSEHTHE